jgi:hypothetical protein
MVERYLADSVIRLSLVKKRTDEDRADAGPLSFQILRGFIVNGVYRFRHTDCTVHLCMMILFGMGLMSYRPVEGSESHVLTGKLKIEGEHIESLTLLRSGGGTRDIDHPNEIVMLEPGTYQLESIQLRGGYHTPTVPLVPVTINVRTGETAVLKVGSPLKHVIDVKRNGRLLSLKHELIDVAGCEYVSSDRSNPPSFVVYSGEKLIGSGEFEYG